MSGFYMWEKKTRIQREMSSLKTYHHLVKIVAFYLNILIDTKILVYLSVALAVFFCCSR